MKKIVGLLLSFAFVMIMSSSLFTVKAADTDAVLIYVESPDGWDGLHVWAWDDDGTGAFANLGWPGKAMVADENNPGWFYLYVPSTMTNVIVNANDSSVQTEAFAIAGENVWVTIAEQTTSGGETTTTEGTIYVATVSTTQATVGDLPVYVATRYIFAYVPIDWDTAGIWAWNNESGTGVFTTWPGAEMTLRDDGWFMYEIPVTADRVIINNFDAENTEKTIDLTVPATDAYVQIGDTNADGNYEATITDTKPVIIEDGYTLYITVPEDWTEPCLWAWSHPDGTNMYTTWPGEPITYDDATGYYTVMVPSWVNKIIINNGIVGDGAAQTVDTDITEATDKYIYVGDPGEDGKYTTSVLAEPMADEPAPEESSNAWIYGVVGAVVVILAAGTVVFLKKRKAA